MKKNQILVSYSLIFCPICLQENNTREGNVSVISNGAARSLLHKTARTPAPYNQSEDSGPGRSRVQGSSNQGQFWTRNVLSRLWPSGQADPTNYSQLV